MASEDALFFAAKTESLQSHNTSSNRQTVEIYREVSIHSVNDLALVLQLFFLAGLSTVLTQTSTPGFFAACTQPLFWRRLTTMDAHARLAELRAEAEVVMQEAADLAGDVAPAQPLYENLLAFFEGLLHAFDGGTAMLARANGAMRGMQLQLHELRRLAGAGSERTCVLAYPTGATSGLTARRRTPTFATPAASAPRRGGGADG
jgi:hypothetical protein